MTVLTMYFAGSAHGLDADIDNDTMVEAFNKTLGPKVFIPGPGGLPPKIYVSQHYYSIADTYFSSIGVRGHDIAVGENITSTGVALKRAATGKGWNRSVWYAINIIADYLRSDDVDSLKINIVGHSRGSIAVIMLLNDIFHEHLHPQRYTMANPKNYRRFGLALGKKEWERGSKSRFKDWYKTRLRSIWRNRLGAEEANRGLDAIDDIKSHENKIESINAFLFDPVAGINQGCTSRKQDFPDHPKIKRVRVLRMEHGSKILSTHMPLFPGFVMLSGEKNRNLDVFTHRERLVIPLPGSHGAGLSFDIQKKDKKFLRSTTILGITIELEITLKKAHASKNSNQVYIGTSYMVGLLAACGTHFSPGFEAKWGGNPGVILNLYNLLKGKYEETLPTGGGAINTIGGVSTTRRDIHKHHTQHGYLGGYVNAHHRFLASYI